MEVVLLDHSEQRPHGSCVLTWRRAHTQRRSQHMAREPLTDEHARVTAAAYEAWPLMITPSDQEMRQLFDVLVKRGTSTRCEQARASQPSLSTRSSATWLPRSYARVCNSERRGTDGARPTPAIRAGAGAEPAARADRPGPGRGPVGVRVRPVAGRGRGLPAPTSAVTSRVGRAPPRPRSRACCARSRSTRRGAGGCP
jgi:hypothetical protein